jgi:amidase
LVLQLPTKEEDERGVGSVKKEAMSSEPTASVPVPSKEQLESIARKHHLNISAEDLGHYRDHVSKLLSTIYEEVNKYPDQCLPVKYNNTYRAPTPEENPFNAWACITNSHGTNQGKLSGRTIAIKDNISMAGVPMTVGSSFMDGYMAQYNAVVVDRILDAGGIIKGKSTCEAMCYTGSSFSASSGLVLNPHDKTRSAGGSSSGSGVLVASGDVDMALGTDQGGSIRLPASWCGVVGLKPTRGLVSYTGIGPLETTVDNVGPMTKTVKDCTLLLEVIAGSDGGLDPRQPTNVTSKEYTKTLTGDVRGIRVGLLREGFDGCDPDVAALVQTAANSLTKLGASVEEFSSTLHTKGLHAEIHLEKCYFGFC